MNVLIPLAEKDFSLKNENQILKKSIDVGIHSMKDVPASEKIQIWKSSVGWNAMIHQMLLFQILEKTLSNCQGSIVEQVQWAKSSKFLKKDLQIKL